MIIRRLLGRGMLPKLGDLRGILSDKEDQGVIIASIPRIDGSATVADQLCGSIRPGSTHSHGPSLWWIVVLT